MQHKNLYAYTAPTPPSGYPEYISINLVDDGTRVSITVRSRSDGANSGSQAEIRLSLAEYEQLRRRLA